MATSVRFAHLHTKSEFADTTASSLTHVLNGAHYDIPGTCGVDPAVCCTFDFKRLTAHYMCGGGRPAAITAENVARRSEELQNQYRQLAARYSTPVVLAMLGDDFRFTDPTEFPQHHDNYVQLMDYINAKEDWKMGERNGPFVHALFRSEVWHDGRVFQGR